MGMRHIRWTVSRAALAAACSIALGAAWGIAAGAAGAPSSGAQTNAAPDLQTTQPAHWVKKKIHFNYQGFTTHYSCQGLTEQVRGVLLQLGARKQGLDIHPLGCTGSFGSPQPFPQVAGTIEVLEPLSSSKSAESGKSHESDESGSSGGPHVAAHWQAVRVSLGRSAMADAGQCELLEQVKSRILPLFATRDVRFQTNCFPHHLTLPGAVLQLEVLKPIEARRPASARGG